MDIDTGRLVNAFFWVTILAVFLGISNSLLLAEYRPQIIVFSDRGCEILLKSSLNSYLKSLDNGCFIEAIIMNHSIHSKKRRNVLEAKLTLTLCLSHVVKSSIPI